MNTLTKEQAFAIGKRKLKEAGCRRIPVENLSSVRTTVSGRKVLDLCDEEGKRGKIGAIWLDGRNSGSLTGREQRASRKLITDLKKYFAFHVKEAECRREPLAKKANMFAALDRLYYLGMKDPQQRMPPIGPFFGHWHEHLLRSLHAEVICLKTPSVWLICRGR